MPSRLSQPGAPFKISLKTQPYMRFLLAALRVMMMLTTFAVVLRGPCLSMAHPEAGQANLPGCSAQNTTEKWRSTLFPATTSALRITSHIPHTFLVAPSGNFCARTFSCLCSLKASTNLMENRRISAQKRIFGKCNTTEE